MYMAKFVDIKCDDYNIEMISNGVTSFKSILLCMHGFNGDRWGDGYEKLKDMEDILVCSYDSAGHGKSEVKSLDMRLNLINRETEVVVEYLNKKYKDIPIVILSNSYGSYRTMYYLFNSKTNIKHVICINPAFRMLSILEKTKEFDYEDLKDNDIVSMKRSLNKFITKKFIDDLYYFDVYKFTSFISTPITLVVGLKDNLIPRSDINEFIDLTKCDAIYVNDAHCLEDEDSWNDVKELIRGIV